MDTREKKVFASGKKNTFFVRGVYIRPTVGGSETDPETETGDRSSRNIGPGVGNSTSV